MKMLPSQSFEHHCGGERGLAALLVIYGLSVFSVLALTMITDPELERKFRAVADYDLHVVLFGGRSNQETIVSRLNVPTILRESTGDDFGVELQIPVPEAADMTLAFVPGSTYSVNLSTEVRVCCDTGDGACANVPADSVTPVGTVNRTVSSPKPTGETTIQFDLSTFPPADNLTLDPAVSNGNNFLIKAAKNLAVDAESWIADANLMCKIESAGKTIAIGTLVLQPTSATPVTGPFVGRLTLKYGLPKTPSTP